VEQTVISIIGILVQELDVVDRIRILLDVTGRPDIFSQIAPILVGIHHGQLRGVQLVATIDTDVDSRGHALASLSGDLNHTIRSLRTIERSTIVQDFHLFDVLYVKQVEQVVVITVMKGRTVILHIPDYAIHNNQRLSDGVQRVDTVDKHGCTLGWQSTTRHNAKRAVQRALDFTFYGNRTRIFDRRGRVGNQRRSVLIERYGSNLVTVQLGVLAGSCLDGQLYRVIVRTRDIQCSDKFGSAQGVLTVFVSHRGIQTVIQCLHTHTGHGFLGSSVEDGTGNLTHHVLISIGLFCHRRCCYAIISRRFRRLGRKSTCT